MALCASFFQLVGVSSDDVAEHIAEDIVNAFRAGGPEAVRLCVCRHVAQQLQVLLHIHTIHTPGRQVEVFTPQQQTPEPLPPDAAQQAERLHLGRDAQELYHAVDSDGKRLPHRTDHKTGLSPGSTAMAPAAKHPAASDSSPGGGAKVVKTWDERYAELRAFVEAHGQRPKRLADDHERQLYFWMMLQHRNIKDGKLSADRAALILPILAIKTVKRPSTGPVAGKASKRQRTQQQADETDEEQEGLAPWQEDAHIEQGGD